MSLDYAAPRADSLGKRKAPRTAATFCLLSLGCFYASAVTSGSATPSDNGEK